MIQHQKQVEFLQRQSRFNFLLTGRRGGKTIGIVEDMLMSVPTMPYASDLFYIGPTNSDAKELIWDEFEERAIEMKWPCKPLISKSIFMFPGRRRVFVIGAEKIRRIRGKKVKKVYMDEIAYWSEDIKWAWERAIRPTLTDLKGGAIAATTPDGKGSDAYKFYLDIISKEGWAFHHWKTIDNPFIDPDEIETARRELDPRSFKQEYEATWESFEGLAYYCFDETMHIKKTPPVTPEVPIGVTLDFNVNPTSLLVVQKHGDTHHFKKEYSLKNSSTIDTVKNFCEDFKDFKAHVKINVHGDSTGEARSSTTGFSDYHYVKEVLTMNGFTFEMKVLGRNPPPIDRVNYANAYLKNVRGESRVVIDPSCRDLILDLSSQELVGRFLSDKGNLGHKGDAFGYYFCWQELAENRKRQGVIQL